MKVELTEEPFSECDSCEEEEVVSFQFEGKTYLRSDTDVLYDATSHDVVGKYVDGKIIMDGNC